MFFFTTTNIDLLRTLGLNPKVSKRSHFDSGLKQFLYSFKPHKVKFTSTVGGPMLSCSGYISF